MLRERHHRARDHRRHSTRAIRGSDVSSSRLDLSDPSEAHSGVALTPEWPCIALPGGGVRRAGHDLGVDQRDLVQLVQLNESSILRESRITTNS